MYVGAALSAVSTGVGLATRGAIRTAVEKADPNVSAAAVNTAVNVAFASIVVGGLLGIGLWIWMAVANGRGHSWARTTSTVFFAINTIGLLLALTQHAAVVNNVIALLVWVTGLTAMSLLWKSESSAYFKPPGYLR